jgi:hypothetical protein
MPPDQYQPQPQPAYGAPPPGQPMMMQPGMMPPPGMPMMMAPPEQKSTLNTVGAVMNILGAVFLFINVGWGASLLAVISAASGAVGGLPADANAYIGYLWTVCVILPLVGAIFAILAAVFMFKKTKWTLALVGGILGLVGGIASGILMVGPIMLPNPVGLLAFIFCLIGVIGAGVSKKVYH